MVVIDELELPIEPNRTQPHQRVDGFELREVAVYQYKGQHGELYLELLSLGEMVGYFYNKRCHDWQE